MKKKLVAVVAGMTMVLALTACGGKTEKPTSNVTPQEGYDVNYPSEDNGSNYSNPSYSDEGYTGYVADDNYSSDYNDPAPETQQYTANPLWEGFYTYNSWNEFKGGYMEVKILDNGIIDLHYCFPDKSGNYQFVETDFSDTTESDGSYSYRNIRGNASMSQDDMNAYLTLTGSSEDYLIIDFYAYDREGNMLFEAFNFRNNIFTDFTKPENYVDEDVFGLITAAKNDNSGWFTPVTDYYAVHCFTGYTVYVYDRTTWKELEQIPYDEYRLYSFNELGLCINVARKYVFADEAAALRAYNYYASYEYEIGKYHLDGKNLYIDDDQYERISSLMNEVGVSYKYKMYYGCNYVYSYTYEDYNSTNQVIDDRYHDYYWLSKPFTGHDEYMETNLMTADTAKIFSMWDSGYYACTDEDCDLRIYYNGYLSAEMNLDYLNSYGIKRVYDDHAVVMQTGTFYPTGDYLNSYQGLIVYELVYNPTTVEFTTYVFETDDVASLSINFDNYNSISSTYVESHSFDMTKKAE